MYGQHSHNFIAEAEANAMALDHQLVHLLHNRIHLPHKASSLHLAHTPALNAQIPLPAQVPQVEARHLILLIPLHHMQQDGYLLLADLLQLLEVLDLAC